MRRELKTFCLLSLIPLGSIACMFATGYTLLACGMTGVPLLVSATLLTLVYAAAMACVAVK